jgi:probable phosphomutase (TIGR03848 family)
LTTLYFVRHGVTAHTGVKLSGWMDTPLDNKGIDQARATAEALAATRFKEIYSSPVARCLETAKIVAEPHRKEVRTLDPLGEVRYGAWTDRSLKQLSGLKVWRDVQHQPSTFRFPDGETLREVQTRAVDEIERLRGVHRKDRICCVSHADVIRLVFAHYLGVHIDLFQRIIIGPASVSILSLGDHSPRVMCMNWVPDRS